jgi:hypothetical protein
MQQEIAWRTWSVPLAQGADVISVVLFVLVAGGSLLFALVGGIQAYSRLRITRNPDLKDQILFFGHLAGGLPIAAVAVGMYFAFLGSGNYSPLVGWLSEQPLTLTGVLGVGLVVIFLVRRIHADPRSVREQIPVIAAEWGRGAAIVIALYLLLYLINWL